MCPRRVKLRSNNNKGFAFSLFQRCGLAGSPGRRLLERCQDGHLQDGGHRRLVRHGHVQDKVRVQPPGGRAGPNNSSVDGVIKPLTEAVINVPTLVSAITVY